MTVSSVKASYHPLYNRHACYSPKGRELPGAFAGLHRTRELSPDTEQGLEIIYLPLRFANYKWAREAQLTDRGEEQVKSH